MKTFRENSNDDDSFFRDTVTDGLIVTSFTESHDDKETQQMPITSE